MRRTFFAVAAFILITALCPFEAHPYYVLFKEQYYRLYHIHYNQYPDDIMENIYWLEKAVAADFCNPLYAVAKIEDKTQWEKYRYLFMMHLNLKLSEQHLRLGVKWDKQVAYFYNAPWKEQNLECLEKAEICYNAAEKYWQEALLWAEKANQKKFQFLFLTDVQNWEDDAFKIKEGKLDYGKTISRELMRLEKVRADFEAMDENTY